MKDDNGFKNKEVTHMQVPTRPATISDTYGHHKPYKLGKMPIGGFQSVWRFEEDSDSKNSFTSQSGGKKVY
jgi:hypothetical protein